MKPRYFTPEEDDYIRANYLKKPLKRISKDLGRSESGARQRLKFLGLEVPKEIADKFRTMSRFQKGHSTFNKGKKQTEYMSAEAIERTKKTRFKKGDLPHTAKEGAGTISIRKESQSQLSYKYICIEYANWKLLHLHLWELENGEVPEGHCLWFKDNDTMNCEPSNMELITRAENLRRNNQTDSAIASKMAKRKGVRG
jgi:hypothetical protein